MPRFYRHKQIARFSVGQFHFVNHIATIQDDEHDEFLREYEGLQGVDKVNIVEVMQIENERPVQRIVRGSLDTLNTIDSQNHMARASDLRNESKEQQLRDKEAALAAFENELNEKAARLEADLTARQAPIDPATTIGQVSESNTENTHETTLAAALGEVDPNAPVVDEPALEPAPVPEPAPTLPAGLRQFGVKPIDAVE